MNNEVEEVKAKTDIVGIIGERIELKKAGRNYKANCPFHGEDTPSFMVSPELQIYKCFGCGEGGDVFSFLEKYEGMDFGEALKYLAERAGVKLTSFKKTSSDKEIYLEINSLAAKFYNFILLNHPQGKIALKYLLEDRGIKKETIEEFNLGYSPENPLLLNKFLVEKKKFKASDIEKAGIGFARNGFVGDRFRGRIIFPIYDHRGSVIAFSGRVIPGVGPKDTAKYINSPETPTYHKSSSLYGIHLAREFIKKKGIAIIVEGELDMISSWQIGVKNTVAIKGSSLTEEQVRLLSRFCKKIILALDADFAGDEAAKRGIKIAQAENLDIKVAKFEGFKDPDEMAREDPEGFKNGLIGSVSIWDFLIDSIFKNYNLEGSGKAKISKEVVPVLGGIEDKIVQAHYIGVVSTRLGVPEDAVLGEINKIGSKAQESRVDLIRTVSPTQKNRRVLLEERLLTLCFQTEPGVLLKDRVQGLVVTPLTKRILEEFAQFSKDHLIFNPSDFASFIPKELVNGFSEMILADAKITENPDTNLKEIDWVVLELEVLEIRRNLEELGSKIRKYEGESEQEKLKDAQVKFGELTKKLSLLEDKSKLGIILH